MDHRVHFIFHRLGIQAQGRPFAAGGLGLADDARLKLAQGVLAVEDEHPVAGADGFALGFREPPPFLVTVLQIAVSVHAG